MNATSGLTHGIEGVSPPTPRLALTVSEAAESLGMSATAFRDHLYAACPKFFAGRSVRIPLKAFEEYVLGLVDADPLTAEAMLQDAESSE